MKKRQTFFENLHLGKKDKQIFNLIFKTYSTMANTSPPKTFHTCDLVSIFTRLQ